jgi:hypothetical protein
LTLNLISISNLLTKHDLAKTMSKKTGYFLTYFCFFARLSTFLLCTKISEIWRRQWQRLCENLYAEIVTGISKFSHASMFSSANQFEDLIKNIDEFSTLFGFISESESLTMHFVFSFDSSFSHRRYFMFLFFICFGFDGGLELFWLRISNIDWGFIFFWMRKIRFVWWTEMSNLWWFFLRETKLSKFILTFFFFLTKIVSLKKNHQRLLISVHQTKRIFF